MEDVSLQRASIVRVAGDPLRDFDEKPSTEVAMITQKHFYYRHRELLRLLDTLSETSMGIIRPQIRN